MNPDLFETLGTSWTLSERVALVTGGSSGIGLSCAEHLLAAGARVCLVARGADRLEAVRAQLDARFPGRIQTCAADVTHEAGRRHIVDVVASIRGRLDVLVCNAGMNVRKSTVDYTDEELDSVFESNSLQVLRLCRSLHPYLRSSASASIVCIGSVAGATTVLTGAPYAMSKAGVAQLTRYLAVEWAPAIRINCIHPWYIDTPLVAGVLANEDFRSRVLERTPLGRIGAPADVASLALFLSLPAAAYITGQVIAVDGGFLARGL